MEVIRVFISYSREGTEHESWVLRLATDLRQNGVDASLDKWDLQAGQDLTFFMESRIRDSDFVVLVCTPTYAQKSNISSGGVGYEKNIISAEMLQSRDLRPKFIPILRSGDFDTALPTYLGSKYAIDFRDSRNQEEALDELLRAIHDIENPSKPPLGPNRFAPAIRESPTPVPSSDTNVEQQNSRATPNPSDTPLLVNVVGHVESWESRARGRFQFLREDRIDKAKGDPFNSGYWQASFALQGALRPVTLAQLLEMLRTAETGRTGWDVGWVPSQQEIRPYPFEDGIEVWLAENGRAAPAHSDFWRAEKIGTFALFRGYEEDEDDFKVRYPKVQFDFSLMLWRVAEVLLYLESFSKNLAIGKPAANLRIRWVGLQNRRLGNHNPRLRPVDEHICRQDTVVAALRVEDTSSIRETLIRDVQKITAPMFEAFDFFNVDELQVKSLLRGLFDADKEGV